MKDWQASARTLVVVVAIVGFGTLLVPGPGSADPFEMAQESWVITPAAAAKQAIDNVCNNDPNKACHELCAVIGNQVIPQGYFMCLPI